MSVHYCEMGNRGGTIVVAPPEGGGGLISASVGAGGAHHRSDVVTVRTLLNRVPSAKGGPSTPLKVDGIAGPLTLSAIRRFQSANIGFADGRVDPGGQTIARLSALATQQPAASPSSSSGGGLILGFAVGGAAVAAGGAKPTPLAAAIAATATAKLWTAAALSHLTALQQGLIASGGVVLLPTVFDVVNTHFHLDRDPSSILLNIGKAIGVFNRIVITLSDPATFYREGPETDKSKFADAPMGGLPHRCETGTRRSP